ncbi:MAG: sodium:solute symporter family protein [Acidobacteriota bacterium]
MNIALVFLLAYGAAMVAAGLWIGRRVQASSTFFVAGRRLGPGLLFATILAANIGAGSTVGAASLGYRDGFAGWWWVGAAGIGTILLGLVVGPRLWRVAKAHDLRTVGDHLEWRYGKSVRATVAVLLWLGTLAILAGQLIAMAWVLNAVAGVPKTIGCLLGGGVMVLYFAAGGLLASAWINLVQLIVLLVGFVVALPLAIRAAGGFDALQAPWDGAPPIVDGASAGLFLLPLLVPAFIVSPGLIQKLYGARDASTVRRGVALAGVALLAFAALPPLLGMAARVLHPDLAQADLALPMLLVHDLPPAIGLLGLAAVFSAEISSADALLFMLATSLSRDLYQRFVHPQASDAQVLRVARGAAVVGGAAGIVLAMQLPSVIDALRIFYALLTVTLTVPLLGGLVRSRAGTREALAAMIAGVVGLFAARAWVGAGHALGPLVSPTFAALLLSALVFLVVERLPSRAASA